MNNAIAARRCLEQLMWDDGEGADSSINEKYVYVIGHILRYL